MGHCLALPVPQDCSYGADLHFQGRAEPGVCYQENYMRVSFVI